MPAVTTRPIAALALAGVVAGSLVAGCGSASASASPAPSATGPSAAPSPGASAEASRDPSPSLTPVPGGQSDGPGPVGTHIPTTQTDWGEILDDLPSTFPAYPNADPAEVPDTVSAARLAPADAAAVAGWYRDAFTESGYAVELSDAAEDGSQVLDAQADLPECRIQMTFRPEDGDTMITILVASACANGTG